MKEKYEIPASEEIKVQVEANVMTSGGDPTIDVPEIPGCDDNED